MFPGEKAGRNTEDPDRQINHEHECFYTILCQSMQKMLKFRKVKTSTFEERLGDHWSH